MGRVKLLFGEWSSDFGGREVSPRHVPPDGRRPIRMQAGGDVRVRWRLDRRGRLWARALRSRGVRRRAWLMGLMAGAVQILAQLGWWRVVVNVGVIVVVALVAGAWTEVSMIADAVDVGCN